MSDREHVTFRPGELSERLFGGPLSAGATAKRDLSRYYVVLGERFDDWWNANGMWDVPWGVIVEFVGTRGWDTIPTPSAFFGQFEQYLRSPMASGVEPAIRRDARDALSVADPVDVIAVIDRAEQELRVVTPLQAPSPA